MSSVDFSQKRHSTLQVFASAWAPLPIRLIVGFGFLAHGYAKLGRGPGSFGVVLQTLGVPEPQALAWLTTLVELVGGGAVLAGAFIPIVSVPMAIASAMNRRDKPRQ
ncbi:DoxX family protein [Mesorhizobium caraganae]|uniref:DoxX family protein n=1 Tax=Mesorhizobium caraganae TaxID=483206 RepID=UPI00193AB78C|nr:DoxX family protein [Mesorhizobium caraganae]MBM2714196.1 DoxX family protein [Mesorhizobium caraganae]